MTVALPNHSDDTRLLVKVALWALKQLYRPNFNYAKAGVILTELVPREGAQTDLFSTSAISSIASDKQSTKSKQLMSAIDNINRKMGKESIKLASEGFKRPWKMKQENKSPSYTSKWDEVLQVEN